jgi:hypothetical protein
LILDIQEETSSMESTTATTKQVGIIIVIVVWFVSILCSALGAFIIARALSEEYVSFQKAESAVQQGAAAAMGIAISIVPYCIARALSETINKIT